MLDFLFEYGMFLAKSVTVIVAVAIILILIAGLSRKSAGGPRLTVEKLNEKFREMADVLQAAMLNKSAWKKREKEEKKEKKQQEKAATTKDDHRKRIFVLDFKGDIRATGVANLREEITGIVAVATDKDEVVLRLENPGGAVHEHGLAASQLLRIKERGIPLTVIVDKIAASGGYLMACIADRIIAAPFAVIGSIGVIAQIPNFHRVLESKGVDFEQVTAGKYKRTVTMFGRNTDEDRAKLKEELEDVHALFKLLVARHRPDLDVEAIATGEHWYGTRALELGLIDELGTSDDVLMSAAPDADIFEISYRGKQTLQERLMSTFEASADRVALWVAEQQNRSRYR
ncbi:MAG: protease SohB [Gammaproteobacteria bacterium]|nr:MAG: protease SohB [Gammaproteobacteria bacterium]